ncbi:YbaN family protein [Thiocystis violascens]|uniref:DUF454 domain-containing protein n=1 Tax=Thiocystis violascens (strain ATCC 17096 / DSM 198 / 6111) TaxID=765911 RepID=I3Y7L7_THIV6|nr:YbaN family protein [Thiocystis violascens]AFL72985.1 hypothetical protein Thivi_0950 [Thiocystis violascens DSM 198]
MHGTAPAKPHANAPIGPRRRLIYNLLAWLCFGLGFVGMVVPLMPTTVFWICAAWLWLRSHPQRVRFLVDHPHFGASIRGFLEHGEICRTGKTAAVGGMAGSYLIWFALVRPGWVAGVAVAAILGAVALWIATRPDSKRKPPAQVAVTLDLGRWTPVQTATKPPANPPG